MPGGRADGRSDEWTAIKRIVGIKYQTLSLDTWSPGCCGLTHVKLWFVVVALSSSKSQAWKFDSFDGRGNNTVYIIIIIERKCGNKDCRWDWIVKAVLFRASWWLLLSCKFSAGHYLLTSFRKFYRWCFGLNFWSQRRCILYIFSLFIRRIQTFSPISTKSEILFKPSSFFIHELLCWNSVFDLNYALLLHQRYSNYFTRKEEQSCIHSFCFVLYRLFFSVVFTVCTHGRYYNMYTVEYYINMFVRAFQCRFPMYRDANY